jgi:hypothetical protein
MRRGSRRLRAADIRVLVALVPLARTRSGFLLGLCAYQAEALIQPGPHAALGRQAGFVSQVTSVRNCAAGRGGGSHPAVVVRADHAGLPARRPVLDGG